MVALRKDLSAWYDARPEGSTHMIVACPSKFEAPGCCRPVYVLAGEDPHMKVAETRGRIMEVYSFALTKEEQINNPERVVNYHP